MTLDGFARRRRRPQTPRRRAARVPADLAAVRSIRRAGRVAASGRSTPPSTAAPRWCRWSRRAPATARWRRWPNGRVQRRPARRHRAKLRAGAWPRAGPWPRLRRSLGPRAVRRAAPRCLDSTSRAPARHEPRAALMTLAPVASRRRRRRDRRLGFAGSLTALALLSARPPRRADRDAAAIRGSRSASRPRRWRTCCSRSSPIATTCRGSARSRSGAPGSEHVRRSPAGSSAASRSSSIEPGERVRRRRADTSGSCWSPPARTTRSRDTHWYRPDFDHALVREAEREGADLPGRDAARTRQRRRATGTTLEGTRHGRSIRVTARVRHRRQRAARLPARRARTCGEQPLRWLPPTAGRSTRTSTDVERWDRLHDADEAPPYPSTTRRCIRCFRAAGSGSCGSTTASPAPAPR